MSIKSRRIGIIAAIVVLLLVAGAAVYYFQLDNSDAGVEISEPYAVNPEIERKVADLLAQMTLEEKIGQMIQAERAGISAEDVKEYFIGSLLSGGGSAPDENTPAGWADMHDEFQNAALSTRLQIPLIYGVDAVHGHNNVPNATIFPHNIGLGATRDLDLIRRIGEATAKEVRATGLDWTFAPCVCVPQDERWGRTYEGFGEDPKLVSDFGVAFVQGYQGNPEDEDFMGPNRIISTLKHWVGDGATTAGADQGNAELTEEQLRRYMEPYREGIKAGARTVMVSYSSWNGLKSHGDKFLITDVLKNELGFNGIVISDYNGVDQIDSNYKEAIKKSINAGMDMIMVANTWKPLYLFMVELAESGEIPMERIDDAVTRILRVKFEAGTFDHPLANRELVDSGIVGSDEHRAIAREAVRKSVVLLKNEDKTLPLSKEGQKVFVAGTRADDIGVQSGGWTISWQGGKGPITAGTTVLQGIKDAVADDSTVTYQPSGEGAAGHDVAIVVVGEDPYAEGRGDKFNLALGNDDLAVIEQVKASGVPMVVVLLSGRPMIITDQLEASSAFVAAWLPGSEGAGIADLLFGDYGFTGKLSVSWPKSMEQIPINKGDETYEPLFEFGYGLTTKKK